MTVQRICTEEEEVVAKAFFKSLEQNLPPHSNWTACIGAAREAIGALNQHRERSVEPASWQEESISQ